MVKTNALRLVESAGIEFDTLEYEVDESDLSGIHIAEQKNLDPDMVLNRPTATSHERYIRAPLK